MYKTGGHLLQLGTLMAVLALPSHMDGMSQNEMTAILSMLFALNLTGFLIANPAEQRRELVQRFA